MRIKLLSIFAVLFFTNSLTAQTFSFSFDTGYQFKMGTSKLSDGKVMVDQNGNQGLEIVRYSFGEGYHFAGDAMVHLNENWEAGLKVSYLLGKAFYGYTEIEFQSHMLRFIPQVKFTFEGDRLRAFTSIGMIIGNGGFVEEYQLDEQGSPSGPRKTNRISTYSGGLSFGINNAVGVEYLTDSNFNFYLKLDSYLQSYGPNKRELTTYTINEIDLLENIDIADKEVEYVDFLPNGQPQDPDLPDTKLRRIYPFSSFGVSAGASYSW